MKRARRRPNRSARPLALPALVPASLLSAGPASAADVTVSNEPDLRANLGGTGTVIAGETITLNADISVSSGISQMDVKLKSLSLTGDNDGSAVSTAGVTSIMGAAAAKKDEGQEALSARMKPGGLTVEVGSDLNGGGLLGAGYQLGLAQDTQSHQGRLTLRVDF